MKPKNMPKELQIGVELDSFLDKDHQLYQLANILNWDYLISSFGHYYVENKMKAMNLLLKNSVKTLIGNIFVDLRRFNTNCHATPPR